jgi:hypothetical protein
MSTALGIASVTFVLQDLLNNGIIDSDITGVLGGTVKVTALPPDRINVEAEQSALNLFMYQVRPNQGWRNERLPAFDGQGQRISNPPLALDLYYVMSAYGKEELHAEILLGYGMQLLHETPVLTHAAIRQSLSSGPVAGSADLPPLLRNLSTSELGDQVEQIKITLESLGAEEMFRLWTAFQAKYRVSAAYKITVVLIESKKPAKSPLPVRTRNIYPLPFTQISIDNLKSAAAGNAGGNQKFIAGQTVIAQGKELNRNGLTLTMDGHTVVSELLGESELRFTIPADKKPGVHGLQVIQQLSMGNPAVPHLLGASNLFGFVVSPALLSVTYLNTSGAGNGLRSGNLTLNLSVAVDPDQKLLILLNQVVPENPGLFSFIHAVAVAAATFTVPITNIKPGNYLVRVQVDGVESALIVDGSGNFVPVNIS